MLGHFAINNVFVLGCHEAGMSPVDADIICSSLSLPLLIGYWNRKGRFNNLEQRVGEAEVVATEKSMREAMNEEMHLTLGIHECHVWSDIGKDYSWWKNLSEEARVIPENMPRLTVSFDMGWQQRSSGNI